MDHESLLPADAPPREWDWSRLSRLVAGLVLIAYSWVMFTTVPVPYIKITPGSATDVLGLIKVEGVDTFVPQGRLLFLTVSLSRRVTPMEAVAAWLDDDVELVKEQFYTGDLTREELTRINLARMEESKLVAIKVALDQVGYEVKVLGGGALVTQVAPDVPAAGAIEVGDVIVGVDGKRVTFQREVIQAVQAHQPGDVISLILERDGEERTVQVKTVEGKEGVAQVGIYLEETFQFQFPIDVDIDTGDVGGPSAGLAFTLAVIDELTEGELTGGQIVAVTGAIDPDGLVEAVGGVEQKAVAARQAGAVLMLVPPGEADAARRLAGDMTVVAVKDIGDALEALADLGGEALAPPASGSVSAPPR